MQICSAGICTIINPITEEAAIPIITCRTVGMVRTGEYTYAYILPQIDKLEDSTRVNYPEVYAITKILKVEVMHRISDMYGPVIYSTFGNDDGVILPIHKKRHMMLSSGIWI